MILLLKSGTLELMGSSWSASGDGPVINVLIHGGTVGVLMPMTAFETLVRSRAQAGMTFLDLRELCESPLATNTRLSAGMSGGARG